MYTYDSMLSSLSADPDPAGVCLKPNGYKRVQVKAGHHSYQRLRRCASGQPLLASASCSRGVRSGTARHCGSPDNASSHADDYRLSHKWWLSGSLWRGLSWIATIVGGIQILLEGVYVTLQHGMYMEAKRHLGASCPLEQYMTRGEMMKQLAGKVTVITGASSGIGAAIARTFSQAGSIVVLGARRQELVQQEAQHIIASGGQALAVHCDVRQENQAHNLIQQAVEHFGRIDILVNNAGVMLQSRIANNLSDEWRQMIETNVLGLLYTTAAAIPHLKQTTGQIVNISSVAGRKARERGGVYSATKWGVNAISEALRLELLEEHIRVIVIEPGTTATELADHITDPEALAAQQENLKRMSHPLQASKLAEIILWAVSQPDYVGINELLIRPVEQSF